MVSTVGDRFVFDVKKKLYLLFPDCAELSEIEKSDQDGKTYVSVSIAMTGAASNIKVPTPNRTMALVNEILEVNQPSDPVIERFRFVKKDGLTGAMSITCKSPQWETIKKAISTKQGFLPISYRGTSEEYWIKNTITSISLGGPDVEALSRSKTLIEQLRTIHKWMGERSALGKDDLDEWLQVAVDSVLTVSNADGHYKVPLPGVGTSLPYTKEMLKVATVSGLPTDIKIVWTK